MKKFLWFSALLLTLILSLTGCSALGSALSTSLSGLTGGDIDGAAYIQGQLDTAYLGKFDPAYLKMVNITEEEARETYNSGVDVEVDTFISLTNIEYPTEELQARLADIYKRIYAKSDYTVISSAQQSDGSYSVKVTVRPLDTIQLLYDGMDEFMEDFEARHAGTDVDAMTDAEFDDWYENVYDVDYQNTLADLLESLVNKTGTLEEKSIAIQIEKDTDDYYVANDESMHNLDALIIDYN